MRPSVFRGRAGCRGAVWLMALAWGSGCGANDAAAPSGASPSADTWGSDGDASKPQDAQADSLADAAADSAPDAAGDAAKDAADAAQDSSSDGAGGVDASPDGQGSDSADAASAAPVALAELASATASQLCAANFSTCAPMEKMPFATQTGCVAALTAANASDFSELSALVQAGKLSYDAGAAGQCLALAAEHCDVLDLVDGPAACQAVFNGAAVNGAGCKFNVECASHFCATDGVCAGKCKARTALGAACDPESDKCVAGAVCFGGKCVANVAKGAGAACGALSCDKGLYCNAKNKCAALAKLGEACDLVGACVDGAQCIDSGTGGKCQPMPKKGQACTPDPFTDASTQCAQGLVCANDGGEVGTCEPKVALGGACTYSSECGGWDVHCVGPAGGTTCQLLSSKGGPCQPGDLAQSEWGGCLAPWTCAKGKCVDLPGLGEACADDILNACGPELMCDFLANKCIAIPGLGQECFGLCTTGLVCDESATPNVCKAATCP